MSKKFIAFPKIQQFKGTMKELINDIRYSGMAEVDGKPVATFNEDIPLGNVTFKGSVKLHGTNAAICMSATDVWFQSRKRIISSGSDNAGFAEWAEKHMLEAANKFRERYIKDDEVYVIFGEWCGGNIHQGVALNELDKRFVVFETMMQVAGNNNYMDDTETSRTAKWFGLDTTMEALHMDIAIDLNFPNLVVPNLQQLTLDVEAECPYGKLHNVSGIGEGIVWKCDYNNKRYRFKVKGEKHAGNSKVKKLKTANTPEEELAIATFVNNHACTVSRLEQGYTEVFDTLNNGVYDIKKTGDFIRWVVTDVHLEEKDALGDLTSRQVNGAIAKVSKQWLHSKSQEH